MNSVRSLFVKIFLWFWLAVIVIITATVVLISLMSPYRPLREDGRLVKRLAREGQQAVEILERRGTEALHEYIAAVKQRPGGHFFVVNEEGENLAGGQIPPEAKELASRARESGVTEFLNEGKIFMLAQPVFGPDGTSYIVVDEVPRRPRAALLWRLLNPRFLSVRLLVIFIVASIFCYWLAWYLTSPVRKLRRAAQLLASGDLHTRVAPHMGSRRDELADLGRDFDLMAERIDSLITSQGRLLRDISHELRSPLTRLNVALELARQRCGSEAGESLDRIGREAERMNELIGQLRALTLLESGTEIVDKKSVDLTGLVKKVVIDTEFEAGNRNRKIKTLLDEHAVIDGSEELLRRAIENVVRNALRYTPEGTDVEISLVRQIIDGKENAVIKVRDHGPGVPEASLDSLFQPFYRTSDARDRQSGGMGIGLAITDRAIRLHGGNVKALNAPDNGLIIELHIPVTALSSLTPL